MHDALSLFLLNNGYAEVPHWDVNTLLPIFSKRESEWFSTQHSM